MVSQEAIEWARQNKRRIAEELASTNKFVPDNPPVSVFMAGSPGAGKTEFSINLIQALEMSFKSHTVRIDADELRKLIPGYKGTNAYLFQGAVSILVEALHDVVLKNKQTFLLDGTFAKYDKAMQNIIRSQKVNRPVFIFYIYQHPSVAWKFTQAREFTEGRNIPKSAFIEQFLGAKDTIGKILEQRSEKDKINIYLVRKNFELNSVESVIELSLGEKSIDGYINKSYTKVDLEGIL